jgi:hypothetical protein
MTDLVRVGIIGSEMRVKLKHVMGVEDEAEVRLVCLKQFAEVGRNIESEGISGGWRMAVKSILKVFYYFF